MTISTYAQKSLDMRDDLTPAEKCVIDDTFEELYRIAAGYKVSASGDDRAAELEAAMVKFIIDSRNE